MTLFVEGRNAVLEALRSGVPGHALLLSEDLQEAPSTQEIEMLAQSQNVPVRRVPKRILDQRSERGAHQGVILHAEEYRFTSLSRIISEVGDAPHCLIIALDQVTDPGNLGAIARSAEVFGAKALLVPKRRTAAIGPAAYKSSAGALAWIPVVQDNLARGLDSLKKAGFWVGGADAGAKASAWEAPLEGRLVLVFGSEGKGLSRLVREKCDFLVSLPVCGKVESLNVAQAVTALAYEVRRRQAKGR